MTERPAIESQPCIQLHPPPPVCRFRLPNYDGIMFLHPWYTDNANALLILPRVDAIKADNAPMVFGVHHRTALLACQIIANNASNGYLAYDREGNEEVETPEQGILANSTYYFIIPAPQDNPYPVVPTFAEWQFPHRAIPDDWRLQLETDSTTQSLGCGVTNASFAIKRAHLVPKKEGEWYDRNDMARYSSLNSADVDQADENRWPLRKDIHKCFDDRWFVVVPKDMTGGDEAGPTLRYALHILCQDASELWPPHHNTIVEYLHPYSRPYVLARFAWAVIFRVKRFIISGHKRRVIQRVLSGEGTESYEAKWVSGPELRNSYGSGGTVSATPKTPKTPRKRPRSAADTRSDDDKSSPDSSTDGEERTLNREHDHAWRRQRQGSDETAPDLEPYRQKLPAAIEAELRESLTVLTGP